MPRDPEELETRLAATAVALAVCLEHMTDGQKQVARRDFSALAARSAEDSPVAAEVFENLAEQAAN